MSEQAPDRVTGDDIRGLRQDTQQLTGAVEEFATKTDVRHEREDRRKELAYAVIVALACLILVYLFAIAPARHAADQAQGALDAFKAEQADASAKSAADTLERRRADCHSYDDLANAIKQGNIGSISVLLNPQFGGNTDPARLQQFIDAFAAGGSAAVDSAIADARASKGYSADCTQIGTPPTTQPGG